MSEFGTNLRYRESRLDKAGGGKLVKEARRVQQNNNKDANMDDGDESPLEFAK